MFEKTTKPRASRIAFLPHTLKLEQHPYNVNKIATRFTIAAYWHEVKSGKPIIAFGFFFIGVGTHTLKKLDELNCPIESVTYQQVLAFARKQDHEYGTDNDRISQSAVVKFGHAKPLRYKDMYECYYPEVTGVYHDEQEMLKMQANPNYIPSGADGWYFLNKKQLF